MSITSCYRYVLELPLLTLGDLMRAVLSNPEAGGSEITRSWDPVSIPPYTAKVEVLPADFAVHPPAIALPPQNLAMALSLDMRVKVTIHELPELLPIEYDIHFDLPGVLAKTGTIPPELRLGFPGVTAPMLNLIVSGGAIVLTSALVETQIHALYDASPSLAQDVQNGVPWPPGPDTTVRVTTTVYDDDPGSIGFRGQITVPMVSAASLTIQMPGHFKIQGISTLYADTEMTITVVVGVQQTDGELRIRLSQIQSADVTVVFATPPSGLVDTAAKLILRNAIAGKLKTMAPAPSHDLIQLLPTNNDLKLTIEERLVELASMLTVPLFLPLPPANPGDIDLTLFEPTTVAGSVLALQFVPRADGTPCDPPDVFAAADGFAIAVADVEVQGMLDPIIEGAKGDRHVQGHDITVERLTGELSDPGEHGEASGHFWIDGMAEVHVDCWADPDIDFSGPVFLAAVKQGDDTLVFQASPGTFTADDACCEDVEPGTLANLVAGQQSVPFVVPTQFGNVGHIEWIPGVVLLSRAGVVVQSTLQVTTSAMSFYGNPRNIPYWGHEGSGG